MACDIGKTHFRRGGVYRYYSLQRGDYSYYKSGRRCNRKLDETKMNKKGQISLLTSIVGATGMILASAFAAWATISSRAGSVEARVSVVEEREQNHFLELSKSIEKIDKKLDLIIEKKR